MHPFVVGSLGTILFCVYTTTERSAKGGQSGMHIENFAPILYCKMLQDVAPYYKRMDNPRT